MISKLAYPNDEGYAYMPTVYNLQRWTNALRDIYVKVKSGMNKQAAESLVTKDWERKEKNNFSYWMKYYESQEPFKYATAQNHSNFYMSPGGDYFLPNPPVKKYNAPSPISSINQIGDEVENSNPGLSKEEAREANEVFRRKLISRLNSLEKHLGTTQGYLFAGKEFDNLLDSIFKLKKQIQTHNKFSISAQTCLDLIIKEANILTHKSCPNASMIMIKVAQEMPAGGMNLSTPTPMPAGMGTSPDATGDAPGGDIPGEPKEDVKTGLEGFLQNLEGGGITDELSAEDNEVDFDENEVELPFLFPNKKASYGELVVEAQDATAQADGLPPKTPAAVDPGALKGKPNFDVLVDSAFNHLTVNDLIAKLNDIDLIFKKREISNQLALASVMMAKLNLQHYFPEFSELSQKQLESTTYSATRMQSILTALRGGVGQSNINLTSPTNPNDPEAQLLARHLENEEQKADEAKAARKQVENQNNEVAANNGPKPEIEVESPAEELANPTPAVPPVPSASPRRVQ